MYCLKCLKTAGAVPSAPAFSKAVDPEVRASSKAGCQVCSPAGQVVSGWLTSTASELVFVFSFTKQKLRAIRDDLQTLGIRAIFVILFMDRK